jgi:hypothetical protein
MDKKETTRLLDSLIKYNRVDINNMKSAFPELGDAFMNVILAIDEEYGSGNIDRTLLRTPTATLTQPVNAEKLNFEDFGKQFVGKFVYYDYSKTWIYFVELYSFEENDNLYYFNVFLSNSSTNTKIMEQYTKDTLERFLNGSSGWKFINVKVGDKVKIPKTKLGSANAVKNDNGVIEANSLNQDFLYFNKFDPKTGNALLFWKQMDSGNFYDINEVEPYEDNQLSYKVGDYFTGRASVTGFATDEWVKITEIEPSGINSNYSNGFVKGIDNKGTDYLAPLDNFNQSWDAGLLYLIPDPTISQLSFKVGDRFYLLGTPSITFTILEIKLKDNSIIIIDGNGNQYERPLDYAINSFKNGQYVLLSYKVGDYFTGKNFSNVKWIKITEILKDKILGIRDDNTLYDLNKRDFNEFLDKGDFYIIPDPTANQVSFKIGDAFKIKNYPADTYVIIEINLNKKIVDIRNTTTNTATWSDYQDVEDNFKNGEYILLNPTPVSNANAPTQTFTLTKWTKDWKANGLRPSPTRKASLEKLDALGVGNDGVVYEVVKDKNGTKKWKKTGFTLYNPDVREQFTSKYDLQLLYDQIVYENSQLYPTDLDYEENEKLITKIMEELKTK